VAPARKDGESEDQDRRLRVTRKILAERERRLAQVDAWAHDLEAELETTQRRLEELEHLREEYDRVRSSAGYRLGVGSARRLRRWFPRGTLRGRLLSGISRALHLLLRRRAGPEASPAATERAVLSEDLGDWTPPETTPKAYRDWIKRYEPGPRDLDGQRAAADRMAYRPLVSVVVPTWNPDLGMLQQTVDSVLAQTYDRWELCIADGASSEEIRAWLQEQDRSDPRLRVRLLKENLGISGNTNEALAMAGGEFVAFLDQSDLLAPFALYEVARSLNRDPDTDVLYSDWDILSPDGSVRFNALFTPEWSPELLLSANYASHLLVVRRSAVRDAGGLRPALDGAQDWDLLFRVSERTQRIRRVPAVLYHWRADERSAALSLTAKPRARAAQERAVQGHLDRRGLPGRLERVGRGHMRVQWKVDGTSKVSIIIPTPHNRDMLRRCLEGISRSAYTNREVIVIETSGRDRDKEAWYEALARDIPVRVLWWEGPFNYSAVNNFGAANATGEILLFLNDDTWPDTGDWLEELVGWAERDEVGVVGAHLVGPKGTMRHGGVVIGLEGFAEHLFRGLAPGEWSRLGSTMWYRNLTAVTGACMAIPRQVFDRVGGWDERFLLCGSDVELCLRVRRAGYRVVCTPFARVRHLEAATRGSHVPEEDFFTSFWHYQPHLFGGDPYFNPNLAYTDPIPRLRHEGDATLPIVSGIIGRDLSPSLPDDDPRHAAAMAEACRVSPEDLDRIRSTHGDLTGRLEVTTVNWFIPDFENPFYGGIHTIFRFADHFQRTYGTKSRFVVIGTGPEEYIRSGLRVAFPELVDSEIFIAPGGADDVIGAVPDADASIATLWVTAFPLARSKGGGRRFYFVQDFEPMFYPAGALYALAEQTYRMGLYGIANTPPLKDIYESYGTRAVAFTPCVDADVFHDRRPERPDNDPYTVFMYGRPGHPRNCYELAVAALRRLKESLQDRVRIVAAGSSAETHGDEASWLSRLGLLDYTETADLYRRCDAGLVLSVSKHPTYIPLQLMASGALVVANRNPANQWLLRDGENCLLADPTADRLAETLERGLLDEGLRRSMTGQARRDIAQRHSDWMPEMERVYGFLCDPEASMAAAGEGSVGSLRR
jgi:GT2 family glycosyltransferase/glycosyltransferase involved in cell wall biosynthesis